MFLFDKDGMRVTLGTAREPTPQCRPASRPSTNKDSEGHRPPARALVQHTAQAPTLTPTPTQILSDTIRCTFCTHTDTGTTLSAEEQNAQRLQISRFLRLSIVIVIVIIVIGL